MNNNLHIHTNISACSKKENSWERVLMLAEENHLDKISITDHNTCLFHVINLYQNTNNYFSGQIVSGIECDVTYNGICFEILAYNFDVIPTFNWTHKTYGTITQRQLKIKNLLLKIAKNKNININTNMLFKNNMYAHDYVFNGMKPFKENAFLFNQYNILTSGDFYRESTTNKNFPLYVNLNKIFPPIKKVIKAIHKFGGIVVLAHPYNYKNISAKQLLNIAKKFKLDGIEVYHPSCTKQDINFLLKFAKENNLIVTGGTDYHAKPGKDELQIQNIDKKQKYINF